MKSKELPRYSRCFVCGKANPAGLDLRFHATAEGVHTEVEIPESYIGFPDRIHGGVLAAIIDEVMGWSCTVRTGKMYYTTRLNIRFRRPVSPCGRVRVEGTCKEIKRWIARAEGRALDPDGEVCVEAEGTFCALRDIGMDEILSHLEVETASGVRPATAEDLVL